MAKRLEGVLPPGQDALAGLDDYLKAHQDALAGLDDYLKAHQKESIFAREAGGSTSWCLFLHGDERKIGRIQGDQTYEIDFATQEGVVEKIHKVKVKLMCEASREEEVLARMRTDEAVKGAPEGPHFGPRYRHHIKNKTLYPLMNRKEVLFFTMLEGEVLRGIVDGFSRFEISLRLKGGVPAVILRHAVFDVRDKKGQSYSKEAVEKRGKYW
jgi:sRNA-binding regulator protein Hfq